MSYETPEPTCPVCIESDRTGSVPPRHDCPDAHVTTDGADTIKIVRGGTGPASPAPPTATPDRSPVRGTEGRGERDADGTGVPPATAPAPLQALAALIDEAWAESCEPSQDDDRSPGELARDVTLDPANTLTVAEAQIEAGRLVFAGCWLHPYRGVYHEHETPPPGAVPLFRIGGAS